MRATSLSFFDGNTVQVKATNEGVRYSFAQKGVSAIDPSTWPLPGTSGAVEDLVLTDLQLLLEQDLARPVDGDLLVTAEDWVLAVELGARSLTAFSEPSHLLLSVDRQSELGRPDFRYIMRWLEGSREVAVIRVGPYVRHAATGRLMHLDGRTVALVEAMDRFNSLGPGDRGKSAAWEAFSSIRADAAATGALLDGYLESNSVIVPTSIGLTVRDHGDGSISFEPRVAGIPDSPAFTTKFLERLNTDSVETLTDASGQRVRVLFSEPQLEVLKRMRAVRRLRGAAAERVSENPASVFDGVGDAVDLRNIERQYGPRVIGVGALKLPSDSRNDSGKRIVDLLGLGQDDKRDEATEAPDSVTAPPAAPARRAIVSIDVVDATTNAPVTLRLEDDDAVQRLHAAVNGALDAGAAEIYFEGKRIVVEPALKQVLESHVTPKPAGTTTPEDVGVVGRGGHLYLLIDEHEDTLTAALMVSDDVPVTVETATHFLPASLLPSTTLQSYQRDGIQWLASTRAATGRRGGILADDMGLGKTLQLLTHVAHLVESRALDDQIGQGPNGPWRPVLIIAPLLLVESGTWTEEMKRHFRDEGRDFEPWVVLRDEGIAKVRHEAAGRDLLGKPLLDPARIMSHKVVITTYETLVSYQHSLAQQIGGRPIWSLVIFDEAQQVKSPATKKSYAAKALDAKFKIAATGTPVETRLRDLWNLLDTVEPTRLGTQRSFVANYERPAQNAPDAVSRRQALDRLREALHYQRPEAFLLRRDKAILTSLPPKVEHRPRCEMTAEERSANARLMAVMRGPGGKRAALSTLHALHMASQHPALLDARPDLADVEGLIAASSRLQATLGVLRQVHEAGEKALVFARSVDSQRMLAHVIGKVFGQRVDVLNGETGLGAGRAAGGTGTVRRQMLDRFRRTPGFGVIVLSPFVAGVGLTLVEANHVIHYGRWWNPAVEGQATDRAFRIGQTRPVHVYYPILTDPEGEIEQTLDEALDVLITSRRGLATDFLSPNSEDDDAAKLFTVLAGEVTAQSASAKNTSTVTITQPMIGGLLVALAERETQAAVWLGASGRLGAHVLRREGNTVSVVRICEKSTQNEWSAAADAGASWSEVLNKRCVPVLASRDGTGATVPSVPWSEIIADGLAIGVGATEALAWSQVEADVVAVQRVLGR